MRRPGRRDLVRALRAAAPDPPADLGRRLADAVPEDLFGPRPGDGGSRSDVEAASTERPAAEPAGRRGMRRRGLAIAASVLMVVGSGYLATRLYEQRGGTTDEALRAEGPISAPAPPLETTAEPPASLVGDAGSARRQAAADAARAPRTTHAPETAETMHDEAVGARASPPAMNPSPGSASARREELVAAEPRRDRDEREAPALRDLAPPAPAGAALDAVSSHRPARDPTEELAAVSSGQERREAGMIAEQPSRGASEELAPESTDHRGPGAGSIAERRAQLEGQASRLRAESFVDVERRDALAVAALDRDGLDRDGEPSSFSDASARPVSTLTVEASEARLLRKADTMRAGTARDVAPLADLLDDVARTRVAPGGPVVAVETAAGPPSTGRPRVFVFVSAIVAERGHGRGAAVAPDTLELELDPLVSPRYRLLDSEARLVGGESRPPAGARPRHQEVPDDASPLFRLSALYELEVAGGPGADRRLGVVRLHSARTQRADSIAELDRSTTGGGERVLDVWSPVRSWESTGHQLRLAVLAARLAEVGAGGPPDAIAAIQGEIARAEREAAAGSSTAESAARLRALADALTGAPGAAEEPAAPTAPRD